MFQVFELGLQGLRAHIIDALPRPDGQCIELYPNKPIYDIPAFPSVDSEELVARLMAQIEPFDPVFHFGQQVVAIDSLEQGARLRITTDQNLTIEASALVIAAGAGCFEPVRLKIPEIEAFAGSSLYYHVKSPETHAGKEVVFLGGGDTALDGAFELQKTANSVTLINRSE